MATIPLHSPSPAQTPRRIRFAPLPDPRRAVLVTDDGVELPLPNFVADSDIDLPTPKSEGPPPFSPSELASIPAAISLSALNSPLPTPIHTPQSWNVPLPDSAPSPAPSLPPYIQTTSSCESESSNSTSSSSTSGSPPQSDISSSSSMYSLTPTQSIDPYPASSTGSSTPTMRKSSSLRNKIAFNISTDQLLTLGTINLFRSRSKGKDRERDSDADSIQSAQSGSGWGSALTRWTSGGSGGPGRESGSTPLYRTQSTQSYKGGNVRSKRSSSPASTRSASRSKRSSSTSSKLNPAHESGMISTLHTGHTKKGTRMLNGRVYGARRGSASGSPANPFANAKDDPDPEFVEWGYGGMGSVKNVQDGVGGRVWGRVLSGGTGVYDASTGTDKPTDRREGAQNGSAGDKQAVRGAKADDEDDGSGMGWVRRRREQREQEAREKAEQEAKEVAEKEKQEQEAKETLKEGEGEVSESDASDSRSITSTTTVGTTGTTDSTATSGTRTVRNVPAPLPLPDVGHIDAPSGSPGPAYPVGSPTPTLGSEMVTPTPSAVGTPRLRAMESILSPPNNSIFSAHGGGSSPRIPSDAKAVPMSRQTSNTPTISSNMSTPTTTSPGKDGRETEHHVMTAVNVPAPPPMSKHHSHSHSHSHTHGHSRGRSLVEGFTRVDSSEGKAARPQVQEKPTEDKKASGAETRHEAAIGERAAEIEPATSGAANVVNKVDDDDCEGNLERKSRKSRQDSVSSTSSSASSVSSLSGDSESESESEKNRSGDNESDDEDDSDEEESEEEKARKTSLGAGVEKISRHK